MNDFDWGGKAVQPAFATPNDPYGDAAAAEAIVANELGSGLAGLDATKFASTQAELDECAQRSLTQCDSVVQHKPIQGDRNKLRGCYVMDMGPSGDCRICKWKSKLCAEGMTTPDGDEWPGCYNLDPASSEQLRPSVMCHRLMLLNTPPSMFYDCLMRVPSGPQTLLRISRNGDVGRLDVLEAVLAALERRAGQFQIMWPTRSWRVPTSPAWKMIEKSSCRENILCSIDRSMCSPRDVPPDDLAVGWIFPDHRIPDGTVICRHFTHGLSCYQCRWCFSTVGEAGRRMPGHVVFPIHRVAGTTVAYMPRSYDRYGRLQGQEGVNVRLAGWFARSGVSPEQLVGRESFESRKGADCRVVVRFDEASKRHVQLRACRDRRTGQTTYEPLQPPDPESRWRRVPKRDRSGEVIQKDGRVVFVSVQEE